MKTLESKGYIKGEKRKQSDVSGNRPTEYTIVYDVPVLLKILKEYPNLLKAMQKNDTILFSLIKKHYLLLGSSKDIEIYSKERLDKEFALRLKLSPTFFELCLENNTDQLIHRSKFITNPINSEKLEDNLSARIARKFFIPHSKFIFDIIFETCVKMDILKGNNKNTDLYFEGMPILCAIFMNVFAEYFLYRDDLVYLANKNRILSNLSDENLEVMNEYLKEYNTLLGIANQDIEECSTKEILLLFNFVKFDLKMKEMEEEEKKSYSKEERVSTFKELMQSNFLEIVIGPPLTSPDDMNI